MGCVARYDRCNTSQTDKIAALRVAVPCFISSNIIYFSLSFALSAYHILFLILGFFLREHGLFHDISIILP
jgi:hypothetical protein